MSSIDQRLTEMGIDLPAPPAPVAAYVPAAWSGDLLYISGQLPFSGGELLARGPVPDSTSLEQAARCARQCAINALAAAKASLGSLDAITRVVRVGCFVACAPGFVDQPKVANGASEFFQEVFGEAGRHARAAVGSVSLPLGAPVEVEVIFEAPGG